MITIYLSVYLEQLPKFCFINVLIFVFVGSLFICSIGCGQDAIVFFRDEFRFLISFSVQISSLYTARSFISLGRYEEHISRDLR
jgi:hypothetical protein